MTYYEKIQKHFAESVESNVILFRSSVSGRELWSLYMKGFGEDPVYRDPASSVHNCNNCRNFIERYGNIVSVDPDTYEIQCIWDVEDLLSPEELQEYGESLRLMTKALKEAPIGGIFAETHDFLMSVPYEKIKRGQEVYRLGIEKNLKQYTQEEAKKLNFQAFSCEATQTFTERYSFEWEGHHFDMQETPGHSPGSCCILLDGHICFTGDSLLKGCRTITRLPHGSRAQFQETVNKYFRNLPSDCEIYPGHGDHFSIKEVNFELL